MKLTDEKIAELYGYAKQQDCLICKEIEQIDYICLEYGAQKLSDSIQAPIIKRIRYDQAKQRVVFEIAVGEHLLITQLVASQSEEFSVTPHPIEVEEEAKEEEATDGGN